MPLFIFLGALTASHLTCVADRMAVHQSQNGRSACDTCHRDLRWRDVLPIVSWLASRGRARCCGQRLPARYVAWETYGAFVPALALSTVNPVAGWVLTLAAIGLVFTRSYRRAVSAATGAGPCGSHTGRVAQVADAGIFRVAGHLRCGWCWHAAT